LLLVLSAVRAGVAAASASAARRDVLVSNMAPAIMASASEWDDFIVFYFRLLLFIFYAEDTLTNAPAPGYGV
jgi:hypothetical protein